MNARVSCVFCGQAVDAAAGVLRRPEGNTHVACYEELKPHLADQGAVWRLHQGWQIELRPLGGADEWLCRVRVSPPMAGGLTATELGDVGRARSREGALEYAERFARSWIDQHGR